MMISCRRWPQHLEKKEQMHMDEKKVMLSGVQPSGELHLGNYLGAIKNWAVRAEEFD